MKRNQFLKTMVAVPPLFFIPGSTENSFDVNPIIDAQEIQDFVLAAHKDLGKTEKMLKENPLLLNAADQYKRGDFETALGGASHMGRKDIADMLVANGARMDIFNLTFLGFTEIVKGLITQYPQLINAPGPHGFTLLHHANMGDHKDFAGWLNEQGLEKTMFKDVFTD